MAQVGIVKDPPKPRAPWQKAKIEVLARNAQTSISPPSTHSACKEVIAYILSGQSIPEKKGNPGKKDQRTHNARAKIYGRMRSNYCGSGKVVRYKGERWKVISLLPTRSQKVREAFFAAQNAADQLVLDPTLVTFDERLEFRVELEPYMWLDREPGKNIHVSLVDVELE
jgi:hypothetical protein